MHAFWIRFVGFVVVLVVGLALTTGDAAAQTVECKLKKNDTIVRSAPTIYGPREGTTGTNKSIKASARAQNTGIWWLKVSTDFTEGWIKDSDVENCSPKADRLPKVAAPGQRAEQSGYLPASNQRGAGVDGVFVPPGVKRGGDDLDVFAGSMDMLFDFSIKAFERGTSVRSVEFRIGDGEGTRVFRRTDNSEPFCLFEDRAGNCPMPWRFADTGNRWPADGRAPFRPSDFTINPDARYQLLAHVEYADGNSDEWVTNFHAVPAGTDAGEQPGGNPPAAGNLVAGIVEVEPGSTSTAVNEELGLQLRAYDTAAGQQDGDGIAKVVFAVFDPNGALVLKHEEKSAPYCLLSNPNGATRCNSRSVVEDGARWWGDVGGSGAPIEDGPHTVKITVTPKRGPAQTFTYNFEIDRGGNSAD